MDYIYTITHKRVSAYQVPALEESPDDFLNWVNQVGILDYTSERDGMFVYWSHGMWLAAEPGDGIVRDQGGYHTVPQKVFEGLYRKVSD